MTDRTLPATAIVAAGFGMGFAGDHLLRVFAGPGLNFFLLFLILAVSMWTVAQSGGSPLSREASLWLGVGLLCAAALVWRGSGLLRFGTFLAACFAFALPALNAGGDWVKRAGVLDLVEAVGGAGVKSAFGSIRLFSREHWDEGGTQIYGRTARTVARSVFGGTLLALVPMVVFGALFVSADKVFATFLGDVVRIEAQELVSHAMAIAILSWLACGYLVGVSSGTRVAGFRHLRRSRPALGVAEVATALGLVDLLFLSFVVVQFQYLFGGGSWVEVTPGLTYASYARSGFFQLVTAVALAIPWLLGTHALLGDRSPKARWVYRGFAGINVLLLLVIVASAIQRMMVYQNAYGLTELRVMVTAVLVWLAVVVVWFGATVLTGRRDRFVVGSLVTGFLLVGALQIINPTNMVARNSLNRIGKLTTADLYDLAHLGSDAAPILVSRLGELSARGQCLVADELLDWWGPGEPVDWRSFNWSEHQARRAVKNAFEHLRRVVDGEGCG